VTTTPRAIGLLRRLAAASEVKKTHGTTADNLNLPPAFVARMEAEYRGTRKGREELDGEIVLEAEGALWTRDLLERGRAAAIAPGAALGRVVLGLDPPASASGDRCGLVVCGLGADGLAYVLADLSAGGLSPEGWARRVADAAEHWQASLVVAEKNQGGEMIESVLRGVDAALPVRLVAATRSKAARAEPVALRFETKQARLAGSFPELEDQLCALGYGGYEGEGSPDRLDAMVWAMTELLRPARTPRLLRL
jgi:phage terminase large subunit-like protein